MWNRKTVAVPRDEKIEKLQKEISERDEKIERLQKEVSGMRSIVRARDAERHILHAITQQTQAAFESQRIVMRDTVEACSRIMSENDLARALAPLAEGLRPLGFSGNDAINRIAALDPRTQGVIAAPEADLAARAKVIEVDE